VGSGGKDRPNSPSMVKTQS